MVTLWISWYKGERAKSTILQFRHLMERNNLGDELFLLVNVYLAENGMTINLTQV
ncbi:MAG: hypothetical protein ACI8P9_004521 [Parasphingorhabdus sp.]|jgi:hypothetical protein